MDLLVYIAAIFLGLAVICELCLIVPAVACWAWGRATTKRRDVSRSLRRRHEQR
jgi:hypothetical protein